MVLLLPCENEISAHLLRSRLLSHGIPSDVVQDNFATMYGNWLTRPHLLISEEALDDGLELLAVPDEPIGDNFIEPSDPSQESEDLGLSAVVPGLWALISFGVCGGFLLGTAWLFLLTFFSMAMSGGLATDSRLDVALLPISCGVYGAPFSIICWPLIAFARSCRRREDGSLPIRARIVLLLSPHDPLLAVIMGIAAAILLGISVLEGISYVLQPL
jgi:hypothetical protein